MAVHGGDDMTHQNSGFHTKYVPVTPGGTLCFWLASKTEDEAWVKLLKDAAHMPYKDKQAFICRGYTVEFFQPPKGIT